MDKIPLHFCNHLLIILSVFLSSCDGLSQSHKEEPVEKTGMSATQLESKVVKPKNGFNSGFLDSHGNLWFGTNGNGVYHYDGSSFTNYTENNGFCNNQVYTILEDKESNLWFGIQNGLCKYDGKIFSHLPIPFRDTTGLFLDKVYPVINPNAVHSLALNRNGNMWIGTAGGGAYLYKDKKFSAHLSEIGRKQEDGLHYNWVHDIAEDRDGNIWFASMTHGGAIRYNGKNFEQFMPEDGLSDDMVRTIYTDKAGKIWFGFNGNRQSGLTGYDGKSFYTYSEKDGLCSKNILAIYEDKKGNLWLGSGRGGICIYDGATFSQFTTKEEHNFGVISFIIEDAKGNIWFGGKDGLWRLDGDKVMDFTI